MATRPSLALLLFLAGVCCSAPKSRPPEHEVDQSTSASLTPGFCGYLETTDSVTLEACKAAMIQSPGFDSMHAGDCGYWQPLSLDSMRTCLAKIDSAAAQCSPVSVWIARQADQVARRAEWHRCAGPSGRLHFILLRHDSAAASPTVFSYSTSRGKVMVGFDTVAVADLDRDGTDEVIYIESPNGSGPVRESCALIVDRGRLRCWSGPDFRDASIGLNQGELLSRGWILSGGGPFAVPDTGPLIPGNGKSLWFYQPISREGDPLCCSSVHASLWLEALPVGGRFETGQILRSELDSMGKPLRTDTLHP